MQVENKIVDCDRRKEVALQLLCGNIPATEHSISNQCEEEGWYYLPRSSPVISRRQEKKMKKLSSAVSNNNLSHEHSAENLQKEQEISWVGLYCVSKSHQNISPEGNTTPTSSAQRNSQTVSCQRSDHQNTGASPLENGTVTCMKQCLISGVQHDKEISEAFYRNSVDLDQENAHFVVVDMLLEVLEAAKWAKSQKQSDSLTSADSGYEELCDHGLSSHRSSQTLFGSTCSAEILAQNLLMELGRWWTSSEEQLGESLLATVSVASAGEASLSDEIRQKSRMRGTLMWTPPQFQIISSLHPSQRRSDIIASQQFLCAGCGTETEPRYMKKLRYCEYLGRYFCDCCHGGDEAIIPARVLNHWDFGRYPVCQFSKQILESIWEKPVFKITIVAKNLYSQAKELQKFREIQEQMISIRKLLKACRLSEGVLSEFQQLPSYLIEELHLFAMDDLIKIKRGQLHTSAKAVMRSAVNHVQACELCQGKGFICEFCRGKDVLFPFQTDICTRCQECRACFHTQCFRDEACPKCIRIQRRAIRR